MNKFYWGIRACALGFLYATAGIALPAQTFTTLQNFDTTDGASPYASLIQANDGNLYGTTLSGGISSLSCTNGCGTVFKITPSGALTMLYSFCSQSNCTDGTVPQGGLVQAANGSLYGTTAGGYGTVFKITTRGALTTLHTFLPGTDGLFPYAGLVQATNGNLYGTTSGGGTNGGYGTVFKITPGGALTIIHSFDTADGAGPAGGLTQATNGNLYGTTTGGGANGRGTIFEITPSGALTTLHNFDYTDGEQPEATLVQGTDGNLYGTAYGSSNDNLGAGTAFKITPTGTFTTLYTFCSVIINGACTDGAGPWGGLIQGTDGILYGTTSGGGSGDGTIFKITLGGILTTLHDFSGTDGYQPYAGLVQDTNGEFYGTTSYGGANDDGTVFSLSVGLGSFVETQPTSGTVGAAVKILGTNLTGATSVTFNGTAAVFTVVSSSEITTTVPAGATTGKVKVVTPSRTLSSNVNFRVLP